MHMGDICSARAPNARQLLLSSSAVSLALVDASLLTAGRGPVLSIAQTTPVSHTKPYAYGRTTERVRYGTYAERFEIRHGDCGSDFTWSDCSNDRQRTERESIKGSNMQFFGSERWYGWSLYLPEDFQDISPGNTTLGQFKMYGWREPIFYLNAKFTNFNVDWTLARQKMLCPLYPLKEMRGKWTDFVMHIKWANDETGLVEFWVNDHKTRCKLRGALIADRINPASWEPYVHYGIYRSYISRWFFKNKIKDIQTSGFNDLHRDSGKVNVSADDRPFEKDWGVQLPTAVDYYDEFRVGNSRAEVDIRMIEARGGEPVD